MIRLTIASLAAAVLAQTAAAHETIMTPASLHAAAGEMLPFAIHSTHVLFEAEEVENIDIVSAHVVAGDETTDVVIREGADALEGDATAPTDGPFWMVAHRHGVVWSSTPDGWKRGGRDANPDATSAGKFERFSKALINAATDADAASWGAPLGHALEIVPLDNPAGLKAGEALRVQVLHGGEAVSAQVEAGFRGFTDLPETYAYVTRTVEDETVGPVATIKPWAPGLWAARVELRAPGDAIFDNHVLRATLVFEVE